MRVLKDFAWLPTQLITGLLFQVAFLASAVGPRVAAACAHASLAALSEDNSASTSGSIFQTEGSGHNNRMNSESMHGRDAGPHGDLANSIQHKDNSAAHGSRNQNDAGAAPLIIIRKS
nr:SWI/SNF complex subunit SWI3C-like isoform X2 [Ziziphus jujuba var. spinosa]